MNSARVLATYIALAFLFVALGRGTAIAQLPTGVTVQLFQPPPNQLKIADLWRIRLTNTSQNTYTVCLFGTLTETGIGKLLVDATTARFTLPPGSKLVTGADIQPINANYYDEKYKSVFLRTGSAPTGEYQICVEVRVDCDNGPAIATDCKNQIVQQLTPPILIAPQNQSTVEDELPVFSWMPPAPLRRGQQVRYVLKVVEMLGRQTPYDAMQSNPAWFERRSLSATVLQYPISARKFTSGARYAWMVTAADGDFPMGESEIWEFDYARRKITDFRDPGTNPRDPVIVRDPRINVDVASDTTVRKGTGLIVFTPPNRGVQLFNPTGDVKTVFASPDLLKVPPIVPQAVVDQLTKKNEMKQVLNELLRSCNE